ncbi:MAG: hypothetical protein ACRENP_16670 [Longimicrobiales bacterium]
MSRHSLFATATLLFMGAAAGCNRPAETGADDSVAEGAASNTSATADLDNLRKANERFNDVKVALAEGYIADPSGMCVTAEMEGRPAADGAMGIHYLRPDLLGLAQAPGRVNGTGMHTDFSQPAVLIYEPQQDGSLKLVAIENLVWTAAWQQAGNTTRPSYQGQEYNQMTDDPNTTVDEAHGFESHYDLHVWLYRENPNGVFSPFNPAVSCAHGQHAPAKTDLP